MPSPEAIQQYNAALRAGQREYRSCVLAGRYPYPQVLDDILDERMAVGRVELGTIDIPMEQIVGTKSEGRRSAFAADFMPLLPERSEFGAKWMTLCDASLSGEGIRDPIRCYEYLGRFYVQEGNKRVSVLKSLGSPLISAKVTRIVPPWSEDIEIRIYYEFMDFYRLARLYTVQFSRPGSYLKLQAALGYDADHVWTEDERRRFNSAFTIFKRALHTLRGNDLPGTESDIFLLWLQVFSLDELKDMTQSQIASTLERIWPDTQMLRDDAAIDVSTEPEDEPSRNIFGKLLGSVLLPSHLNVAFLYERPIGQSPWIMAHELGREHLDETLGDKVTTRCYVMDDYADADAMVDAAAADGAQVLFAVTTQLISACRKAAVKYPELRIFNCSVSMPFPGVRTYYSRIYEGKFISGAIAGAMSKSGKVGYIASNPIYGVPAGINAFALGARMTNPDVRVALRWSCVSKYPMDELRDMGCDMISNRDIPTAVQHQDAWGLCRVGENGRLTPIVSPVWNWGEFYVRIIRAILCGAWDDNRSKAVNYWWGLSSGAIDIRYSRACPKSMQELADFLKRGIIGGILSPFSLHICAQDGREINDGSHELQPDEILHMDWLCDRVDGSIPSFEELLPMARSIVRLQGVYRDTIPPDKDDIQI